jgi:site-specific DNA recombinase
MKIADLYIRVSTDEQADKGYSQRNQDEMLRRYCDINTIQVRKVIFEDHSAKTFNRPEWSKFLSDLRKHRSQSDLILFTKWDRFSRNAGDAYQMISILRKLGIEPQAIEQPLDLTIPENKMMLAFYLAAPEVENDRRALNTFFGMRRAKKEGRWMASAPIGYMNKITENGRKLIAPKEPQAGLIRWVFEELATGQFNTEQIWKQARQKGLKCSKHGFWLTIRNPVYCGKIFIPKYKDEEAHFVEGQQEPLITESMFCDVQDILNGRKKTQRTKIKTDDNLPLRGFLVCPRCGRLLTGSASKGAFQYYHYYHCTSICGFRCRADKANSLFVNELRKYVPHQAMVEVHKLVVNEVYKERTKASQSVYKEIMTRIDEQNDMLARARKKLMLEEIDATDYRQIKQECEKELKALEATLTNSTYKPEPIHNLLDEAVNKLSHLDSLYEQGSIVQKREIISSIFPEKLTFDGFTYRTLRLNEAVRIIYSLDKVFGEIKNETNANFLQMSRRVTPQGLEPWTR